MLSAAIAGALLLSSWLRSEERDRGLTPPREAEGGTSVVPPGLTPPPEVTPSPPTHITIRGQQVPLAPGMRFGRLGPPQCDPSPCPQEMSWQVSYAAGPAALGYSLLVFDEDHNLVESKIKPEHQDEFQPLLDVLLASIIIRGEPIPLLAGMTYGRGVEVCDPLPCRFRGFWHVEYDSPPTESSPSRLIFDADYNVAENSVRPEDQDEYQPLLDALAAPP